MDAVVEDFTETDRFEEDAQGSSSFGGLLTRRGSGPSVDPSKPRSAVISRDVEEISHRIRIAKAVVFLIMIVSSSLVSAGTYFFLQREENDSYRAHYKFFINAAREGVEVAVRNVFGTTRALANTLSTQATDMNQDFPYVTFPGFEALGDGARKQAGYMIVVWEPHVEATQLEQWNSYAQDNQGWIETSRAYEAQLEPPYVKHQLKTKNYVEGNITPAVYFQEYYEAKGHSGSKHANGSSGAEDDLAGTTMHHEQKQGHQGEMDHGSHGEMNHDHSNLEGMGSSMQHDSSSSMDAGMDSNTQHDPTASGMSHSGMGSTPATEADTNHDGNHGRRRSRRTSTEEDHQNGKERNIMMRDTSTMHNTDDDVAMAKHNNEMGHNKHGTEIEAGEKVYAPDYGPGPYYPYWMQSPPPADPRIINFDGGVFYRDTLDAIQVAREGLLTHVEDITRLSLGVISHEDHAAFHIGLVDHLHSGVASHFEHPHSTQLTPVFATDKESDSSELAGVIVAIMAWDRYMVDLLPEGVRGLICVVKNSCNQSYSYELDGNVAYFLGFGDLHDPKYDNTEEVVPFSNYLNPDLVGATPGHCIYSFHLYSSSTFESVYRSRLVMALTVAVTITFAFMICIFQVYAWLVRKRNTKVVRVAEKTDAIVSNLFPGTVRDRMLEGQTTEHEDHTEYHGDTKLASVHRLKAFLATGGGHDESKVKSLFDPTTAEVDGDCTLSIYKTKPIADLFPETTIMFADLVGFTAWSSTREPSQVFTLLENIYGSFDEIATKRRVFKVETVGDCYVAVCGLPNPRADHAVVMARFARDCMFRLRELVHKLEVMLGPDTADLSMRFGLHSGPVTAGVLRGERARFQLFGDTMNMASRMESTGKKGRIQMSQDTADLIRIAGKENWIVPREELVVAKGKGKVQTFWLNENGRGEETDALSSTDTNSSGNSSRDRENKQQRLIDWNVQVLLRLLKEIQASPPDEVSADLFGALSCGGDESIPFNEVQEVIHLPKFKTLGLKRSTSLHGEVSQEVVQQVQDFVGAIALMYRDNDFHSFEHASHVTLSTVKLLARIVAPDLSEGECEEQNLACALHDHTYGITSDPLTQFACVFAALIHDLDHSGVPNSQVAIEEPALAEHYQNHSIAEQKSVDLGWNLLMKSDFSAFRSAICRTKSEETRFRHLVVNAVLATDIVDRDLKALRDKRWESAFSDTIDLPGDVADRRATIVIEHLIQASDVVHTMQHWHIYRKWNERLFREMCTAYSEGRGEKDPVEFWYQGEIGFFDFYIIPLAKKLKDCGVFGASGDEYLNYAMNNRDEWAGRGNEIVAEMAELMRTSK